MNVRNIKCLRCQAQMRFAGRENLQLGKTGWLLGDLPNLFAGALEVAIFTCPNCGKIEFFEANAKDQGDKEQLPQRKCPECGCTHDFDYGRCPACGYEYK